MADKRITSLDVISGTLTDYKVAIDKSGLDEAEYAGIGTSSNNLLPSSVLDADVTLAANSDTKIATQKAVKTYADALIAANDAMVYQGVIDCSANPNYPAADAGHTYRTSVAGKIGGGSGPNVEIGDILLCLTDSTASGDHATVGTNWNIIQVNTDGAVIGPSSSTDLAICLFDGATGKLIKNSLVTIDASGSVNIPVSQSYKINGSALTQDNIGDGSTYKQYSATEQSKLSGIEASADVTDTANVTAAGALIDSELASIADVKALDQSVVAGASPAFDNIILDSTPDADHTTSGNKAVFTANENQAFGDVCYIDSAGEMAIADADAAATSRVIAMCADATISADASGNYLLPGGIARDDAWNWTVGGPIYLTVTGTTTNTLSQTAPSGTDDVVRVVGYASHADRMIFNPDMTEVIVA